MRAKWMQNDIINGEDISADAITNCLKTSRNTLSTWQVSGEDEINEAILAIVSSGQQLDAIDVVCLERSSLESQGIELQQTRVDTPIKDLVDRHIDISNLTYTTLIHNTWNCGQRYSTKD